MKYILLLIPFFAFSQSQLFVEEKDTIYEINRGWKQCEKKVPDNVMCLDYIEYAEYRIYRFYTLDNIWVKQYFNWMESRKEIRRWTTKN